MVEMSEERNIESTFIMSYFDTMKSNTRQNRSFNKTTYTLSCISHWNSTIYIVLQL